MELSIPAEIQGFVFIESSLAVAFPSGCAVTQVQPRLCSTSEMETELFSMLLIFNSFLLMFP